MPATSGRGLTAAQVEAQRVHGFNDILVVSGHGWRALARDTARDPMLWFLVGTAILFGALGELSEALTLLVALVPLVGMDAFLHWRTSASTAGLATRLASTARVLRDGRWVDLPARELVPGDLVEVGSGEYFPADGVLVGGEVPQVDESTLTGESLPVRKSLLVEGSATSEGSAAEHWAAAGTRVLAGRTHLRVVYTGAQTRYGEIARAAEAGDRAHAPLQVAINELVRLLLIASLLVCVVLAAIRLWQGHGWLDAAVSAATLAVAAIPEEFPVVYTFFLGLGVYRLARKQALVRRSVAVENIGRVTCICTDKTGTITAGKLSLSHCAAAPGFDERALRECALGASRPESGDPLDLAIATRVGAASVEGTRLAVFPFTEPRRKETAVWLRGDGRRIAYAKGAPETVLALCTLTPSETSEWLRRVQDYAATGHKVVACAWRALGGGGSLADEPAGGFTFGGLLAFEDEVRDGVREAISECTAAGMRVIMVTGDHPATGAAIAREVGLGGERPDVATLEPNDDAALLVGAGRRVDVVARATPTQKLALVKALQGQGEIVAVTGDGVNDVPALQQADIGIAMGEGGTRSAREIAAVVLLDDNLRTIVQAVREGRQLFRNLQLSFLYLLLIHIPLVLSAALIPLLGMPLLYLPIHVVWLELIIHPTAMLAFQDLPDHGRLAPVERGVRARFFSRSVWVALTIVALALTGAVVVGYQQALGAGREVEHARAMAMAMMAGSSVAIAVGLTGLRTKAARVIAVAVLASLGLLVQVPALSALLHLQPLHGLDWALVAANAGFAAAASHGVRALRPRRASAENVPVSQPRSEPGS